MRLDTNNVFGNLILYLPSCMLSYSDPSAKTTGDSEKTESHAKTLDSLQQQYETSRYLTHIARGSGLGYGSELPSASKPPQQFDTLKQ